MKSSKLILPEHMQEAPLGKDGKPMKRFITMVREVNGGLEKAIFIDGEQLDWSVDASSLMEARKMGPKIFAEVQKDIIKHFCESVSEVIGRNVTHQEIIEASKRGWI